MRKAHAPPPSHETLPSEHSESKREFAGLGDALAARARSIFERRGAAAALRVAFSRLRELRIYGAHTVTGDQRHSEHVAAVQRLFRTASPVNVHLQQV